ncbi:50S ribosomal protein L6 [Candidatus Woesearchaeota archaeon]|nr:50S ribosomal protein L6 [Candidatus Woesearchaeota archaeon]
MAKEKVYDEEIEIPEKVKVILAHGIVKVTGPKGELEKKLLHPKIKMSIEGNKIKLTTSRKTKTDKRMMYTFNAHLKNLIKGVEEGFTCKLKICSGHFPMNVSIGAHELVIKNFIGEKVPRKLKLSPKVKVAVQGDDIIVEGIDRELVGQTAGSIEQITRRNSFDRRIFQQGIYITEKP